LSGCWAAGASRLGVSSDQAEASHEARRVGRLSWPLLPARRCLAEGGPAAGAGV